MNFNAKANIRLHEIKVTMNTKKEAEHKNSMNGSKEPIGDKSTI